MSRHLSLTVIGHLNDRVHAFVADRRTHLGGCHFIDVRINRNEAEGGYAQDGTAEERDEDAELSMGIRVRAGERVSTPGYFVHVLGSTEVQQLEAVLGDSVDYAYRRDWVNAARQEEVGRRSLFPSVQSHSNQPKEVSHADRDD